MKKNVLIIDNWFKSKRHHLINEISLRDDLNVTEEYNFHFNKKFNIIERLFYKLRIPLDSTKFNHRILSLINQKNFDYILVIKGNYIKQKTLDEIKSKPNIKLYHWSNDNMSKNHNTSRYFENGIRFYDKIFTVKGYNVDKLKKKGARNIIFFDKAFAKKHHFIEQFDKRFEFDILFIGSAEKDRYEKMKYLSLNGFKVNIFGNMWNKRKFKENENLIIHRAPLEGKQYRQAISSSKITLCFLRKINDDLQTSRTYEIPACNGFMIAERTSEHSRIYKEDKEAVFFSSKEELLTKVKYYLKNHKKRKEIQKSGYNMIKSSKYQYMNMVNLIFNDLYK